ncbi:hypothetical protein FGO68_gene1496 [Halteria grandinella]|uniref:Major facilitator superfamily (MFS) profile domain-containing protein n=1 Tax=Halteria grandinella TaxID=5974 RepID=A0A8J8T5G7_HALGN|nr:hypothetical protein FGO68_gene1496 [Halteria grandinella]
MICRHCIMIFEKYIKLCYIIISSNCSIQLNQLLQSMSLQEQDQKDCQNIVNPEENQIDYPIKEEQASQCGMDDKFGPPSQEEDSRKAEDWIETRIQSGESNCMCQVAFIPIATLASQLFGVSNLMISMCSLVFSISFIPFNFIAIKILGTLGLRTCLIIASLCTISGAWLRMAVQMSGGSFMFVIAGQVVIACGQPFFFNTISNLSSSWFGEKERVTAVTLMSNAIPLGSLIANVIPSLIIKDDASVGYNERKQSFMTYLIVCNLIVTGLAFPLLIFARSSPPTPPSLSASMKERTMNFKEELKALFLTRNFNLVNISISLSFAAYVSFLTVQDLLYQPFGFKISGLVGSMICARMLDGERPKYKKLYNMCSVSGLVMNGVFIVTLPSGMHKALFGVNLFLYGFFMIPTFSIIFPYVVELTYPSNESVSNGVMLFCCRLFATAFGVIATLLAEQGFYQCAVFITGVTLCGVIPAFFIDEELRKQQMTMFYKFFKKIETLKKRSRSMSNASPGGFNQSPGGGGRTSMVIRKFEIEQQQPGEFQLQIRRFEQGSEIIEEESEQSDGQSEQSEQQRKRKMLNPEEIEQSARKSKRSMQTSQRMCSMTARVYPTLSQNGDFSNFSASKKEGKKSARVVIPTILTSDVDESAAFKRSSQVNNEVPYLSPPSQGDVASSPEQIKGSFVAAEPVQQYNSHRVSNVQKPSKVEAKRQSQMRAIRLSKAMMYF